MAERKLLPNSVVMAVKRTTDADYSTIVCLTNVSTDATVDEIEANTFCGPDKQPGTFNQNITAEAQHLINPSTGKISGYNLKELMLEKAQLDYKIFTPAPLDGDPIETGQCFITQLGDTYALDEVPSFSITFACQGVPTLTQYEES